MAKSISRLSFELATKSGHDFEGLVSLLLGELMDGTAQSKRLGRLDRMGVDAITVADDDATLKIAIQCKGFELTTYGTDQHRQCRNEIAKYSAKGPTATQYWLIVNRPIKDRAMRKELEADLALLVKAGKAETALLLDSAPLKNLLQSLATTRLAQWAEDKRELLFEYYRSRMEFVQYIADVPFNGDQQRPAEYILDQVEKFFKGLREHQTSEFRHPPKFLITSEFGFGKTSTLQACATKWFESGGHLVYVPAALLDHEAFRNSAGLSDALLTFLLPDDVEISRLALDLFRTVLRSELGTSKNWIVLVDGLDENAAVYKANGLSAFWNSMSVLGVPAILSVRDELIETRRQEFFPDPKLRFAPVFEQLKLDDWPLTLIVRFVHLFSAARGGHEAPNYRTFRQIIESGKYAEVYGDIPKRPLFLGMLADDAWAGNEPERQLHRLYGQYFRKEFLLDRTSVAAAGASNRPSAIVDALGGEEATERLIHVMQDAADDMLEVSTMPDGHRSALHRDMISERRLRQIAETNGVPFVNIEDIAMHSLLQPAGRDQVTRERLMRFAHRSFQDWFLARQYVEKNRDLYQGMPATAVRFFSAMQADLRAGKALP